MTGLSHVVIEIMDDAPIRPPKGSERPVEHYCACGGSMVATQGPDVLVIEALWCAFHTGDGHENLERLKMDPQSRDPRTWSRVGPFLAIGDDCYVCGSKTILGVAGRWVFYDTMKPDRDPIRTATLAGAVAVALEVDEEALVACLLMMSESGS